MSAQDLLIAVGMAVFFGNLGAKIAWQMWLSSEE
jgi:hypothetical protein